ncbi:helix-turn-helix domain-containing protein [Aestuariibaculum suncheonense]|uniref:Helix-turn-helix transcriptional regulator n=1 Tax=Aestuariibaculum suncheonense TaxID=1028745 RepID=A0A8J6UB29_9FLAO|nr:helix-turn-helix transcriptional regulator [Aestuariibaculum suncheonense]MBD0835500.1 helix-turn-helix transcriptional regulator [Aestuariibaculum suncheonense]
MINTEEFTLRLERVINFYGESASSFAEKIGVQRSSISHILSGRNKPSLEFVLKILSAYPEVELYWLLNGKGSFPAKKETKPSPLEKTPVESQPEVNAPPIPKAPVNLTEEKIFSENTNNKTIERIVVFYSDGTFKNYHN